MPTIKTSIPAMLDGFSRILPVEKLAKPTTFEVLGRQLLPTITFRPGPLVDQLNDIQLFALTHTLVGAEDTITYFSTPVPVGEVHRYYSLWVSTTGAANRRFTLAVRLQRTPVAAVFASGREVEKDVPPGVRTNMLSPNGDLDRSTLNFSGVPLDLYPGMTFDVTSNEALSLLSVTTFQGYRLRMIGPDRIGDADVSGDYNSSAS